MPNERMNDFIEIWNEAYNMYTNRLVSEAEAHDEAWEYLLLQSYDGRISEADAITMYHDIQQTANL